MSLAAASPRKRKRPLSRRDLVLPVHRWLALTLGLIVLASAVTGAGMAFRKELDMWGQKYTVGSFLVALVLNGCAAYRTQLFCYLKACGRAELGTMNLWAGIDPAPATT